MSNEIDWSNAPEGATHWEPNSANALAGWMRLDGGKWFFWPIVARDTSDIRWHECVNDMSVRSEYMIPRPAATATPSWSGEGLPPVGVVCEVNPDKSGWRKSVISYIGNGFLAWLQVGDLIVPEYGAFIEDCEFRKIRTQEQIESAARIEAAQEWLKSIELEYGEDAADQCESILVAAEAKRMAKL